MAAAPPSRPIGQAFKDRFQRGTCTVGRVAQNMPDGRPPIVATLDANDGPFSLNADA